MTIRDVLAGLLPRSRRRSARSLEAADRRVALADCTAIARVMHAYLDGELDEQDVPIVRAHLDDCDRCGVEESVHRQVIARLRDARQIPDAEAVGRLRAFAEGLADEAEPPTG